MASQRRAQDVALPAVTDWQVSVASRERLQVTGTVVHSKIETQSPSCPAEKDQSEPSFTPVLEKS
jgi:hypothetical protein